MRFWQARLKYLIRVDTEGAQSLSKQACFLGLLLRSPLGYLASLQFSLHSPLGGLSASLGEAPGLCFSCCSPLGGLPGHGLGPTSC